MSSLSTLFFFSLFISGTIKVEAKWKRLFVFGDSYADTGNHNKSIAVSWKVPHGISYPGRPAGRFSDGRVLTDILATFIGIPSPVPYEVMYTSGNYSTGVNFAYGGAGVFGTLIDVPIIGRQVDFFRRLLTSQTPIFSKVDLESSAALVAISGNDYHAFRMRRPSASQDDLSYFINNVVKEICLNLKRLHEMGMGKLLVCGLLPFGCLPENTKSTSFRSCNATYNAVAAVHNTILKHEIDKLNGGLQPPPFVYVDLYSSFLSLMANGSNHGFVDILKPCCLTSNDGDLCGSLGTNGEKLYTLCSQPMASLFWDNVHPTHRGWQVIFSYLSSNLRF